MRTLRPLASPAIGLRSVALDLTLAASLCLCLSVTAAILGTRAASFSLVVLLFWGLFGSTVLVAWINESDNRPFGIANRITLLRGLLAAFPAALLVSPSVPELAVWVIGGIAAIAALLDAVDGWLARRLAECSRFGERFDLEVDAALVLVLSALVWHLDKAGAWVLLSGLLRYGFLLAGLLLPWLQFTLPASRRRRVVCALQTAVLVLAVMPAVPITLASALALIGLLALTTSFARDIFWLRNVSNMGGSPR